MDKQLLDQFLGLLQFPDAAPEKYPEHYKVDIPDDVYGSLTYAKPPTTGTLRLGQVQAQKEVDATTDMPVHGGSRQATRARKGPVSSSSPYEFRQKELPASWKPMVTFDQTDMQNAQTKQEIQAEDIRSVGSTGILDMKYVGFKQNVKYPMPVVTPVLEGRIEEDPVIQDLAKEAPQGALRVFASARSLAAIVTATRSAFRFEVEFAKRGNDVYVNPTADDKSVLYETNLETIQVTKIVDRERATADFAANTRESTRANAEFISCCKDGKSDQVLGESAQQPYVYRRVIIDDLEFIIRCEVDAVMEPVKEGERPKYAICRVFNDFPSELRTVDWTTELSRRRGAMLTNETNANSSKVGRWSAMASLLDAEALVIGYVIRQNRASQDSPHVFLGSEKHTPVRFGSLIVSLPKRSVYGVMGMVFQRLTGVADGTYVFVRDSKQKKIFTIFSTAGAGSSDPQ